MPCKTQTGKRERDLTMKEQHRFMRGVGSLNYLVKLSRPDLSNAVRELSKGMKQATTRQWTYLIRAINYVCNTKNLGLNYQKKSGHNTLEKSKWHSPTFSVHTYVDSDWGSNEKDRKSVTGYCIFLQGNLVVWKSRGQKTTGLSSTEAEYVALSELCVEVLYMSSMLGFLVCISSILSTYM